MKFRSSVLFMLSGFSLVSCASLGFTPRTAPGTGSENPDGTSDAVAVRESEPSVVSRSSVHDVAASDVGRVDPSWSESIEGEQNLTSEAGSSMSPVVPNACEVAQSQLLNARQAYASRQWTAALDLASEAQASCLSTGAEASEVAAVAATQMNALQLKNYIAQTSSAFGRAMAGRELMRVCIGNHDQACVSTYRDLVSADLVTVGMHNDAVSLTQVLDGAKAGRNLVAVMLPLSGRDKKIGRAMLGALLQRAGIYAHKGLTWDFKVYDTQSDASTVAGLVSQISQLGAKLVLGPVDAQEAQAAAKAIAQTDLVMLSFAPNDAFVNDRAFQLSYGMEPEPRVIANLLQKDGYRTVVSAYPESRYGELMTSMLTQNAPSGVNITTVSYAADVTDLRKIAQQITKSLPDVVFLPSDAKSSERLLSFMAQENVWCQKAGTSVTPSKTDTRRWVACLGTSAWTPMQPDHDFKFLQNARYLDYTYAIAGGPDFAAAFEKLYHRLPNVYEILPFEAVEVINAIPEQAFGDPNRLGAAIQSSLGGKKLLLTPGVREVIL